MSHPTPIAAAILVLSSAFALAGCDRAKEKCKTLKDGMSQAEVVRIMGEPKDVRWLGHPPLGVLLIFGNKNLDQPPLTPNGPIAIELEDGASREPSDRTVTGIHCGEP